ncbi:MAG: hypothetical protein ACTSO9_18745 [Candidatus Helarchaeota archaeon]
MPKKVIKVCILGDWGIGRRTYVSYLRANKFIDFKRYRVNWGAPYSNLNYFINDAEYNIIIFYQNSFMMRKFLEDPSYHIFKSFFVKASGLLLMYDITNRKSYEQVKHYVVKTVEMIKDRKMYRISLKNIINELPFNTILVGNKSDLVSEREVSEEQGQRLADYLGDVPFYEVSCFTGQNVHKSFKHLIRGCI